MGRVPATLFLFHLLLREFQGYSVTWKKFIHDHSVGGPAVQGEEGTLPALVVIALVHAQFETIHTFLDGNGRIGRLFISALFEDMGVLPEPLMYVSGYLKQHQMEYYRLLSGVRNDGDWESWIAFFLEDVCVSATDAEKSIVQIATLVAADRRKLLESPKVNAAAYRAV